MGNEREIACNINVNMSGELTTQPTKPTSNSGTELRALLVEDKIVVFSSAALRPLCLLV